MKTWEIFVYVFVAILSANGTFADDGFQPAPVTDRAIVGPTVTDDEVATIKAMVVPDLANLVRTGHREQKQHAIDSLIEKNQGNLLLQITKEGSRATNDVIMELFVPQAMPDNEAKALQLVDDYIAFLEEQLKAESPTVSPAQAVRSLARVVYWYWREAERFDRPGNKTTSPEPRYGYQRIVAVLIKLLNDERVLVSDTAVSWLGNIGGYTTEQAKEATAALKTYRKTVAAQPIVKKWDKESQEMRLGKIDRAIESIEREQGRRAESINSPHSTTTAPKTRTPESKE